MPDPRSSTSALRSDRRAASAATASSAGDVAIGGYSVLQAADDTALQALLDGHPHFRAPGGTIETFESLPMPGT